MKRSQIFRETYLDVKQYDSYLFVHVKREEAHKPLEGKERRIIA